LTCCQQLRAAFALVTLKTDAVLSYDSLKQEKFTPETATKKLKKKNLVK
jgi:hypothetical protein